MSRTKWDGPRSIRVRDITPSHSVEKGRRTPPRFLSQPIYVVPKLFGGYRIHDGNHRLQIARERGDTYITAYVRAN